MGPALPRARAAALPPGAERPGALRWRRVTRSSMWAAAPGSSGSGHASRPAASGRARARVEPETLASGRPAVRSRPRLDGRWRPLDGRGRSRSTGSRLELRATEAGQVGLFPEHAAMLPWLRARVAGAPAAALAPRPGPPAVLHLFAYTGLATLAMAAAGAAVTHVDASRPTVAWARRNAERSGLGDRPIRWIVDDALAFAEREVRRGRRYAGVVLDPPSYGHGPAGRRVADRRRPARRSSTWLRALLEPAGFVLLTAHTPGFDADRLAAVARPGVAASDRPSVEARRPRPDDGRTVGDSSSAPSRARPAGHDGVDALPCPAVLTSLANPRVRAAAALRDRRERDRTGLTLVDGARELRRALDAGVEVVEAFVCEPLLAGPDARAALDRLRAIGIDDPVGERAGLRQARVRRARRGPRAVVRIPSTDSRRPRVARRTRWSSSSKASRSPATSGPSCAAPTAPGVDAVVAASPRTDLFNPNAIRASAGTVFSVPLAAASSADVLAWLRERGLRIVAARVDAERALHRRRPHGPARDRPRGRGRRPDRRVDRPTTSKPSGCRCSAWPTASTSRSAPRSCCTRPGASAASRRGRGGDRWTASTS